MSGIEGRFLKLQSDHFFLLGSCSEFDDREYYPQAAQRKKIVSIEISIISDELLLSTSYIPWQ